MVKVGHIVKIYTDPEGRHGYEGTALVCKILNEDDDGQVCLIQFGGKGYDGSYEVRRIHSSQEPEPPTY